MLIKWVIYWNSGWFASNLSLTRQQARSPQRYEWTLDINEATTFDDEQDAINFAYAIGAVVNRVEIRLGE